MKNLVVFDFDGTITRRDSFLLLLRMTQSRMRFWRGVVVLLPRLVLSKVGLTDVSRTKEAVFGWFFAGIRAEEFEMWCENFADIIEGEIRPKVREYLKEGGVIVSASVEDWIRPWASRYGMGVIGTRVEVRDGKLTGRFCSLNCKGSEKVRRLLEARPEIARGRKDWHITAYGDSKGDKELLDFANVGYMRYFE